MRGKEDFFGKVEEERWVKSFRNLLKTGLEKAVYCDSNINLLMWNVGADLFREKKPEGASDEMLGSLSGF